PDGRVDDPGVRDRQRRFDRVELVRGLELQRGVGHAAALQIDDPLRARVRLTENDEPDDAEQDEQRGEHAEHREELQLDPRRDPGECANERIERPYGFSSFCSCRRYVTSEPWAMICCGVLLMSFTSPRRSAKKRKVSSGSSSRQA